MERTDADRLAMVVVALLDVLACLAVEVLSDHDGSEIVRQ